MTPEQEATYRAVVAADDAWWAALVAAFGRDARNRRYDHDRSAHPEECRCLHAEFVRARVAWNRAHGREDAAA